MALNTHTTAFYAKQYAVSDVGCLYDACNGADRGFGLGSQKM